MKTTTLCIGLTLAVAGTANGQCIQGDINGDGTVNGIDLAYVLQNWGQSCPAVITSVTPSEGLIGGGTAITITGEHLGGVQSVTIGGIPATNVVSVSPTTVTAVTPPSKSPGPKNVVVTTSAGSATLVGGFTYTSIDWGTVLEMLPDPAVVTDPELRERIVATGLPWRVRDNASQIEMLLVPSGTFMMGCSPSLQYGCQADENPVHEVTLTQAFYLGRYEVTQAQWTAVMGSNPSSFQSPSSYVPAEQVPNRPVERVSWNMVQQFSAATGLRLPTEAEWEYACRAGTGTAFHNASNDDATMLSLGWIQQNAGGQTRPTGGKQANQFGLHDMLGNVYEWIADWYGEEYYASATPTNPLGPPDGTARGLRGGAWRDGSLHSRSSFRIAGAPDYNSDNAVGFRAARTP